MRDGPHLGVGNLRMEGCGDCDLAQLVTNTISQYEPTEDMTSHHGLSGVNHFLIERNGSKKPGNNVEHEAGRVVFGDAELENVGGIAVRLGIDEQKLDDFADKFEICANCPNPITWHADSFVMAEEGPVLAKEWFAREDIK